MSVRARDAAARNVRKFGKVVWVISKQAKPERNEKQNDVIVEILMLLEICYISRCPIIMICRDN